MVIEIKDITKELGGQPVLKNITLRLESGKVYGLKGRNGSGKTMLMRAVCGLIRLDGGEVAIDGEVLRRDISFPRSVGVLIESPGFIGGCSGYENLRTLTAIKGTTPDERICESLEMVGLDPQEKKPFRKYSLGMKQKLGIAAAIVEDPELLILDEPTNALDEGSVQELKKILRQARKRGSLILLSCHDAEDLMELSDEVIEMKDGTVTSQWSVER